MRQFFVLGALGALLTACSMASGVMDTGNGTYLVTAQASPLRGGSEQAANEQAQMHCAKLWGRPVVLALDPLPMSNKVQLRFRCQ